MSFLPVLQLTTATLALSNTAFALVHPRRSMLIGAWALFCTSMFFFMVRQVFGPDLGPLSAIVVIGGAATCGWFWLFARALFRSGTPFGVRHVLVVCSISALVLVYRGLSGGDAPGLAASLGRMSANGVMMLSSTILVLAFWEAVRGWKSFTDPGERRLRAGFAVLYAAALIVSTIWAGNVDAGSVAARMQEATRALCALTIVIAGGLAVWYRLGHPLPEPDFETGVRTRNRSTPVKPVSDADDAALAAAVERYVRAHQPYLIANLKVSDLASGMKTRDYKITRAVTGVLGYRNFNQFINYHRVEHAKAMLADPVCDRQSILSIGLESGFGSIGPFNRAFRDHTGMTPREFRARRQGPRP